MALEITVGFNVREYRSVMSLTYTTPERVISYEIDLDGHSPYPHVNLDQDQLKLLIGVLNEALVASQVREPEVEIVEPDWDSQRGWKAPVDTNPSRD